VHQDRRLGTEKGAQPHRRAKAWASVETVRRDWLRSFVMRKTAPKGTAAFLRLPSPATPRPSPASAATTSRPSCWAVTPVEYGRSSALAAPVAQVLALSQVLAAYEDSTDAATGVTSDRTSSATYGSSRSRATPSRPSCSVLAETAQGTDRSTDTIVGGGRESAATSHVSRANLPARRRSLEDLPAERPPPSRANLIRRPVRRSTP
jgi:hypothetical protein